jgi:hypothetical protein
MLAVRMSYRLKEVHRWNQIKENPSILVKMPKNTRKQVISNSLSAMMKEKKELEHMGNTIQQKALEIIN